METSLIRSTSLPHGKAGGLVKGVCKWASLAISGSSFATATSATDTDLAAVAPAHAGTVALPGDIGLIGIGGVL